MKKTQGPKRTLLSSTPKASTSLRLLRSRAAGRRSGTGTGTPKLDDMLMSSDDPIGGYDAGDRPRMVVTRGGGHVPTVMQPVDMSEDELLILPPEEGGSKTPEGRKVKESVEAEEEPEAEDDEMFYEDPDQTQERVRDPEVEDQEEEEEQTIESDEDELTDEETTFFDKSETEQAEILHEIEQLNQAIPTLSEDYQLIDRLGNGTFSSVYKAIDIGHHDRWDNRPWQGHHPESSSAYYQSAPTPYPNKVFVAVKRIYVTSSPERIRNEIAILEDCRSCRHVSQLITAFREEDQVVVIMPYHRNEDFRDFYRELPMACIKSYFQCLLRSLRDIHARGIIHRDVKPANFLFDPRTGIGTLCDFGLACRMSDKPDMSKGACFHSGPSPEYPHGTLHFDWGRKEIEDLMGTYKRKSKSPSEHVGIPIKDVRPQSKANRAGTRGFRAPEVLLKCGHQSGAVDVWAAGIILLFFLTKKFPLFNSNDDTEALMELATILGKRKMEKTAALHSRSFATNVPSISLEGIGWKTLVERLNPTVYSPPKPDPRYFPYSKRAHAFSPTPSRSQTPHTASTPPLTSSSSGLSSEADDDLELLDDENELGSKPVQQKAPSAEAEAKKLSSHKQDVSDAIDLLEKLLHNDGCRRITPAEALKHPFLSSSSTISRASLLTAGEEEEDLLLDGEDLVQEDDDDFFPHPLGQGKCGALHGKNEIDCPTVRVRVPADDGEGDDAGTRWQTFQISAGQGVAIGKMPCEYHLDEDLE